MRGIYWLAGEDGCPFNSLYWHFLGRNRDERGGNMRLRNQYRTWDRFGPRTKEEVLAQADAFLGALDEGGRDYYGPIERHREDED